MRKVFLTVCYAILLTGNLILTESCKKETLTPPLSENNQWILDSMKVYYYWNEQLPKGPADQEPASSFFRALLYPEDRFSYLTNPSENKEEYSSFAWYGFEYALLKDHNTPGALFGTVTLVVPGGPADRQGLKRGDFFTAVNGVLLNETNMKAAETILRLGNGLQLSMADLENDTLKNAHIIPLHAEGYIEQPVYISQIFSSGGRKAGYIFYNQFNGNYDRELLQRLALMRDKGVTELILDLRYNPGGEISTVAKLTGALSRVNANQTFTIYQANRNGGRSEKTFQQVISSNNFIPQLFDEVAGYRMNVDKVVILTTGSTASAAELLINNLRPFTNIIQIGTTTMGKDMASFAIDDKRDPKRTDIVLHPLIFKLYNALGKGDYNKGLKPDYEIDEFTLLPLKPFGSAEDPLLAKALEIAGVPSPVVSPLRNKQGKTTRYQPVITSSGDRHSLPLSVPRTDWK
jgi:C-terminal processing protease CtpA/Prc